MFAAIKMPGRRSILRKLQALSAAGQKVAGHSGPRKLRRHAVAADVGKEGERALPCELRAVISCAGTLNSRCVRPLRQTRMDLRRPAGRTATGCPTVDRRLWGWLDRSHPLTWPSRFTQVRRPRLEAIGANPALHQNGHPLLPLFRPVRNRFQNAS